MTHHTTGPLSGIVVADFSRILAGPLCTMLMGDAGARVIKIEEPARGDETRHWGPPFDGTESAYFLSVNRNKESITLNLKLREGRAIARKLIRLADVVVENFRDEQKSEFGLTPRAVHRVNRSAVLCSITGFDRESPEAGEPGYDLLAQAAGGLMWITGDADGDPMKTGVALSDVLTAHYAHGAILGALHAREKSGRGGSVEVSLLGSTIASLVNVAQNYLVTGREAERHGNAHPSIVPYQTFHARDRLFALAVATDKHFSRLCEVVLRNPSLARDPRFSTNALRVENREALIAILEKSFRRERANSWVTRCKSSGIPAALVQRLGEILGRDDAPVSALRHSTLGPVSAVQSPVFFSGTRFRLRSAPPTLGEHTEPLLASLGYSSGEIARLRAAGVI